MSEIFLSELRWLLPDSGELHQASITGDVMLDSFAALRKRVLEDLAFPRPQSGKYNCYGFVPAMYRWRTRVSKRGNSYSAHWRCAETEIDALYTFVGDFDNSKSHLPVVAIETVCDRLEMMGLSYFYHTTFSHTAAKPKARFIIDISRPISRDEMLRIYVYLNDQVFGGQADASICSPGDFVYGPPHIFEKGAYDAQPLDVDAVLAAERELSEEHPEIWRAAESAQRRDSKTAVNLTPEQEAEFGKKRGDHSVRKHWVTIKNPEVFNPAWDRDYVTLDRPGVLGSHWRGMRSILGSVWLKNKGKLTYGEMVVLFDEIDATATMPGYFRAKYATPTETRRIDEVIEFVMRQPVPDDDSPDDDPPDVAPPPAGRLAAPAGGQVIHYLQQGAGEGKTTEMLAQIAKGGRWLYAVDRIDSIAERREEFQTNHGWRGRLFGHYDAHSRRDGDDDDTTVPGQLKIIRSKIDAEENPNVLCFITHQALAMLAWTEWRDFNLVIDEVIDVWRCYFREFHRNAAVIKEYLEIDHQDGNDSYVLRLTEPGRMLAERECRDAIDKTYHGILVMAARLNSYVWVNKRAWDDPGTFVMEFWTLVTPECLLPFKDVWMLGDQLDRSLTFRMWETQFGIRWQRHELAEVRVRAQPTSELLTIRYFTLDNASFTRFSNLDGPLTQIVKYLQEEPPDEFIWTCNEKFAGVVAKKGGLPGTYLTPKQHGSNLYKHVTCAVWLASMQASGQECETVKRICGMRRDELVEAREMNAMYQFVMRIALRDFASVAPCVVYVFSARQAAYLQTRLGGTIEHVYGVVFDRETNGTGGRPLQEEAKSSADRQRDFKARKREEKQAEPKPEAKSAAQRAKEYRARKKAVSVTKTGNGNPL